MKRIVILIALAGLVWNLGCSHCSQVEKENFLELSQRQESADKLPESRFSNNIVAGEITRGMNGHEVMASWGLPNVYLISRKKPEEYWIYYVEDKDTRAILIYTLIFNTEDELMDWDIDMKRYIDNSYVLNPAAIKEDTETKTSPSKR